MTVCCGKFFLQEREACPLLQTLPASRRVPGGSPGRSAALYGAGLSVSFTEHLLLSSQTSNNPATLTGTTSSCKEKRVETQQLLGRPIYIQAAGAE